MQCITWNVQWFQGIDGQVDIARVVQTACNMADFDVLCLQEVAVHYPKLTGSTPADQIAVLRSLLPDYQVFFGAAVDESPHNTQQVQSVRQRFGNVIATRLPVLQVQHYPLPMPLDVSLDTRCMPRMASCVTVQAPPQTGLGAVRIITTHLEYYSAIQRQQQTQALCALHQQANAWADWVHHAPCGFAESRGEPYQSKPHTHHALLMGDFNFTADSLEYAMLTAAASDNNPWVDAWAAWQMRKQAHDTTPQPATFRINDKRPEKTPITCDFVFASQSLAPHIQAMRVDTATQASDHQPVWVQIA